MLSVLRIFSAFIYLQHGVQKQFGWLGGAGGPNAAPGATPPLLSVSGVAGILETYGGLLLLLGLFTRPVAFLASGEMAVAYWWRHAPRAFWPVLNRGEVAALLCFIFLYLAVAGGGRWSIDHVLARRRTRRRRVAAGDAAV